MSEISLKHEGWIVVADGEKALFLVNEGDEIYPNLKVFKELEHAIEPGREHGDERSADVGGDHPSAAESAGWHKIEKERFAADLSERLYKYAHAHKFRDLILVAPPHVLGDLRAKLHSEVSERIFAEVPKDLTGHPVDRIEKIVLS